MVGGKYNFTEIDRRDKKTLCSHSTPDLPKTKKCKSCNTSLVRIRSRKLEYCRVCIIESMEKPTKHKLSSTMKRLYITRIELVKKELEGKITKEEKLRLKKIEDKIDEITYKELKPDLDVLRKRAEREEAYAEYLKNILKDMQALKRSTIKKKKSRG